MLRDACSGGVRGRRSATAGHPEPVGRPREPLRSLSGRSGRCGRPRCGSPRRAGRICARGGCRPSGAEPQDRGDLRVGLPLGHPGQHFGLPPAQPLSLQRAPVRAAGAAPRRARDTGRPRRPGESRAGPLSPARRASPSEAVRRRSFGARPPREPLRHGPPAATGRVPAGDRESNARGTAPPAGWRTGCGRPHSR